MPKISKVSQDVNSTFKASNRIGPRPQACIKNVSLKPYQQGALDGFCGVYSIVNAIRLITYPSDGIGEDFCGELFSLLLRLTSQHTGISLLAKYGMPQYQMKYLLGRTSHLFCSKKSIRFEASQFLFGKMHLPLHEVLLRLRNQLHEQRCAFIIELSGIHCHWSVIREVSKCRIKLFDSDGLKILNTRDVRMSYDPKRYCANHVLLARSIFLIKRL